MSDDSYYLIRKRDNKYCITLMSASYDDDFVPEINERDAVFDTFEEVQKFLETCYAEYPPVYDFPTCVTEL